MPYPRIRESLRTEDFYRTRKHFFLDYQHRTPGPPSDSQVPGVNAASSVGEAEGISEDVLPEAAGGCADADEDELEPEPLQAASSIIREAARQAMPAMCRFFSMRITTPFHNALL